MKIICLSDNHTRYDFKVPDGDILVHCGDFSNIGKETEIYDFVNWLIDQPHKHKLFVHGNHEIGVEKQETFWTNFIEKETGAKCLHNKELEIDGLKFFGSSITPEFGRWAFTRDNDERKRYWEKVAPDNIDILISHGPMWGILDRAIPGYSENLGCKHLRKYVERVQPKLFASGHIHGGYGQMTLKTWDGGDDIKCVNASLLNEKYEMVNKPITVEIKA